MQGDKDEGGGSNIVQCLLGRPWNIFYGQICKHLQFSQHLIPTYHLHILPRKQFQKVSNSSWQIGITGTCVDFDSFFFRKQGLQIICLTNKQIVRQIQNKPIKLASREYNDQQLFNHTNRYPPPQKKKVIPVSAVKQKQKQTNKKQTNKQTNKKQTNKQANKQTKNHFIPQKLESVSVQSNLLK